MSLAPIKLNPAYKDYLWGGDKLKTNFGKNTDLSPLAESWELSAHKDGESRVLGGEYDGYTLSKYIEALGVGVLGEKCKRFERFPMLIKLIDAKSDLSVQVHPSDEYAQIHEGEYGKTEMWYILDCDEGACLYYGFTRDVTRDEYEMAIKNNTLTSLLNRVPVKAGDLFFIPSGTVHAIGAGIVICEIQQNSNTTYRVYDWGRVDKNGNPRELHVDKALDVSELRRAPETADIGDGEDVLLASCEYFTVRRLKIDKKSLVHCNGESFISLVAVDGEGSVTINGSTLEFVRGESIFIPAQIGEMSILGSCELLMSYVD
jgi:mannose-6-phosphate isomerase